MVDVFFSLITESGDFEQPNLHPFIEEIGAVLGKTEDCEILSHEARLSGSMIFKLLYWSHVFERGVVDEDFENVFLETVREEVDDGNVNDVVGWIEGVFSEGFVDCKTWT